MNSVRAMATSGYGHQAGAYTIFFVAVIGLLTLLATRSMTVTTADSVRITSNTHSSTEAFLAAEEAMALGMEWLAVAGNSYTTALWPSSVRVVATPLSFPAVNMGGGSSNREYTLSFGFEADPGGGTLIKVVGRATNTLGHTGTVSQWVQVRTLLQTSALDAPLRMAGCLDSVTNTPDIFADTSPGDGSDDYQTVSRAATYSTSASACPGTYGTLNTSQSTENIVTVVNAGGDQWNEIFTETRQWVEDNVDALDNVYLFDFDSGTSFPELPSDSSGPDSFTWPAMTLSDGGDGFNHRGANSGQTYDNAWGTVTEPAVVIIRGCPTDDMLDRASGATDGYKFVGLVFIDADAGSSPQNGQLQCDAKTWRRLKVLGSLVVNGDITRYRRNIEIISAGVGGINTSMFPASGVYASAGSWSIQGD